MEGELMELLEMEILIFFLHHDLYATVSTNLRQGII